MKQLPDGSQGGGKRGRPSTGKLEQVRLPPEDREFLIELGEGNLSKGVREAIRIARYLETSSGMTTDIRLVMEIRAELTKVGVNDHSDNRAVLEVVKHAVKVLAREQARKAARLAIHNASGNDS
jgi:hypothetical protein